ncbi:glycoside hydrolase family 27 protein [Melanogaster broomeanus]|nr:glycoside hydrolase family 27 protein [Melanogaster broomeanus]
MSAFVKTLGAAVALSCAASSVSALQNGVGRLPVMGYNGMNSGHILETLIIETAQYMKQYGLLDVGYNHVNLDDCWAMKNRSSTGEVYSDSGWFTCAGYPGSFMHEEQDAMTFQSWGFDFLKYDNCAIPFDDVIREGIIGKYQRMADALAIVAENTGTTFVFSLCDWGASISHSWRIDGDIGPYWSSIASIINSASFITQATNYYGRNDPDMTHFTAWALTKAPLLIGTNLATISSEMLSILKNSEIIAINQDSVYGTRCFAFPLGYQCNPDFTFNASFPAQYWTGQSENGTVIMLINTLDEPADMFFNLTESPWIRAGRQYAVRDLWTHTGNGTAVRNFTATGVAAHGVVALLLQDAGDEPAGLMPLCAGEGSTQCTAENGTRYY